MTIYSYSKFIFRGVSIVLLLILTMSPGFVDFSTFGSLVALPLAIICAASMLIVADHIVFDQQPVQSTTTLKQTKAAPFKGLYNCSEGFCQINKKEAA